MTFEMTKVIDKVAELVPAMQEDLKIVVYKNRKMWLHGKGRIITPNACELALTSKMRIFQNEDGKDVTLDYLIKNAVNFNTPEQAGEYLERVVQWIKENTCIKHSLLVF